MNIKKVKIMFRDQKMKVMKKEIKMLLGIVDMELKENNLHTHDNQLLSLSLFLFFAIFL